MKAQYSRREQAAKLAELEAGRAQGHSGRALAQQLEVPRATLHDWQRQEPKAKVPAALAHFCATEEGVEWLHRLAGKNGDRPRFL